MKVCTINLDCIIYCIFVESKVFSYRYRLGSFKDLIGGVLREKIYLNCHKNPTDLTGAKIGNRDSKELTWYRLAEWLRRSEEEKEDKSLKCKLLPVLHWCHVCKSSPIT